MYGFYQFKDNNNFNKPIGSRQGLSIFPYTGYNNHLPHSRPLPIVRGRISKSRLEDDNAGYEGRDENSQHVKGPLPYIYKVRITGIVGTNTCNTSTCAYLNDRDFYLYSIGNPDFITWIGTFCDETHEEGIYIRYDSAEPNGYDNTLRDHQFDLLILRLIESSDHDIDTSHFVLTLGSSSVDGLELPLILNKNYAKDEYIYALEETIELTATNSVIVDNGVDGTTEYRVNNNFAVCNYLSATATLTPYQYPEQYDIINNHNAYADVTNFGFIHNNNPSIPVITASGTFDVDEYYNTTGLRTLKAPGAFKLTLYNVATRNQGKHVPCDIYFNREFKLKGLFPNFKLDRNTDEQFYVWDNGIEDGRDDVSYIGMTPYRGSTGHTIHEPTFNNINLNIAGTGGYLELSFQTTGGNLTYRHAYNPSIPLRTTTFNTWVLATDIGELNNNCDFDNISISLEPSGTLFQQGKKSLSSSPLCTDNTTPTLANITVRISGHLTNDGRRVEYDRTVTVIQDLKSNYFMGDGTTYNPYTGLGPSNDLYFSCGDNGEDKIQLFLRGSTFFPTQSAHITTTTGSPMGTGLSINWWNGVTINTNDLQNWPVSGCANRYDCSKLYSFAGTTLLGTSGLVQYAQFPFTHTSTSVNLAYSGVIQFDGFL